MKVDETTKRPAPNGIVDYSKREGPNKFRSVAGSALWRLPGAGGRGHRRCAGFDQRHLPGVPLPNRLPAPLLVSAGFICVDGPRRLSKRLRALPTFLTAFLTAGAGRPVTKCSDDWTQLNRGAKFAEGDAALLTTKRPILDAPSGTKRCAADC
jgi:hypothetical protein